MPQMNRGGKFIFGRSLVREDGTVRLPDQAVEEYGLTAGSRVYLFTGSKSTGGFCITRKDLLEPSKLVRFGGFKSKIVRRGSIVSQTEEIL